MESLPLYDYQSFRRSPNTAPSFSQPGSVATNTLRVDSPSLEELLSAVARKLTAMESLGLLSDSGTKLLSLCRKKTATPSTDGPAVSQEGSTTSTSPWRSDNAEWVENWPKQWPGEFTQPTSLGQSAPVPPDTGSRGIPGCKGDCGNYFCCK